MNNWDFIKVFYPERYQGFSISSLPHLSELLLLSLVAAAVVVFVKSIFLWQMFPKLFCTYAGLATAEQKADEGKGLASPESHFAGSNSDLVSHFLSSFNSSK